MSTVPLYAKSRPATPHQPNQAEGANGVKAGPQQQQRIPANNTNFFIEVLQFVQHSQQQLMKEIHQLKADKTKEKGSQHDPKHVVDKEETLVGGGPQNTKQCFIITALLEQERLYARRPPYPLRILSKPYPERYESQTFAQYDGRRGSTVKHVSKFIDTFGPYAANEDPCLREFSKSLYDWAYN